MPELGLQLRYFHLTEVEDGRGKARAHIRDLAEELREVLRPARAARGDDRHAHSLADRFQHGQVEAALDAVRIYGVHNDLARAERSIAQALGGFPVDLRALRDRFCRGGDPFIMHDAPGAEHIFCELYSVPDEIRATYFQLKVLELLLFLQVLDPGPVRARRPYFYRAQVEKVKAARDFMVSDLTVEHTIDELADRFDLPPTAFKTCFKGVYGLPPYAYLRTFRMERAAALLRETDLRVADIGLAVGYDSPSKFTAAFKAVIGQTPTVHRRDRARYVR